MSSRLGAELLFLLIAGEVKVVTQFLRCLPPEWGHKRPPLVPSGEAWKQQDNLDSAGEQVSQGQEQGLVS